MLGLISTALFFYGVYLLYTNDEPTTETSQYSAKVNEIYSSVNRAIEKQTNNVTELVNQYLPNTEGNSKTDNELAEESEVKAEDLWDSFSLEQKYNEMQEQIPFLDQDEFKNKVRDMVDKILNDPDYQQDYQTFLDEKRSARPDGHYAVIEDTALNLAEYYENQKKNSN